MAEGNSDKDERKVKLHDEKEIARFSAYLNAFIETSMEKDRSLLMLSSGAIGLLVTLMTTNGINSIAELALYILSIISFVGCIVGLLYVFHKNKGYIIDLANGKEPNTHALLRLDFMIMAFFFGGVILLLTCGIVSSVDQLITREKHRMDNNRNTQDVNQIKKDVPLKESFVGLELIKSDTTSSQLNQSAESDATSSTTSQPDNRKNSDQE